MVKKLVLVSLIALLFGQTGEGFCQVSLKVQDSLVRTLVNRHIAISQAQKSMPGYRVQIYFGPQRNTANEIKTDFFKLYPNTGAYLIYQQPNFKVRVGDFKTRMEALHFLKEIQSLYPSSFLVKDDVQLPSFK